MIASQSRFPLSYALLLAGCLVVGGLVAAGLAAAPAFARGGAAPAPAGPSPGPSPEESVSQEAGISEALIPEVGGLKLGAALALFERAGFRAVSIEECSRELTIQIHAKWGLESSGRLDHVFQQSPKPGQLKRTDVVVILRVRGRRNQVRTLALTPPSTARVPVPRPPPPPENVPEAGPAREPVRETAPNPAGSAAAEPGTKLPREAPGAGSEEGRVFATGSPEAPRAAPVVQRGVVPALLGLSLSDAEQLVRDAGMTLHVDRVPGHPLGRVLEQAPSAGGRRPAAGIVLVVVTAGGDFEGDQAPIAPEVYVAQVVVPGLLDRTRLQAQRILEDLGLRWQEEEARRGLPGRVVDQMPPAGGRVPKGGLVRIWIGPGADEAAEPKLSSPSASAPDAQPKGPPPAPGTGAAAAATGAKSEPEVPAPKPPLAPGTLILGVPAPLAPGHGTVIPREDAVPIGFSWRGVKGAEAYLLEIEEEAAEGRWIANARKPARKTAVILEVERLQSRGSGRLRWRVSAVSNGRAGTPSRWVLLK